jgi:hypothetical protein
MARLRKRTKKRMKKFCYCLSTAASELFRESCIKSQQGYRSEKGGNDVSAKLEFDEIREAGLG